MTTAIIKTNTAEVKVNNLAAMIESWLSFIRR